ncbi:MAG: hypothetical protein [Circoviridae sp. ctfvP2]|nr:MAG: hypothetical protein [Circoviridae sp. ctfvP2]UOF79958.1 hypothetical protein [Cressdnaviricota sp.]UOF80226.1 hypothetical protein [Cressdnaviricota sp.]UOF82582.1 hypothetical protein [Cressdnaviricota sp.]
MKNIYIYKRKNFYSISFKNFLLLYQDGKMVNPTCIYCNKVLLYLHIHKLRRQKPNTCICGSLLFCCHCDCNIYIYCFKCCNGRKIN